MKIKHLIDVLQSLPPEMEAVAPDGPGGWSEPTFISRHKIRQPRPFDERAWEPGQEWEENAEPAQPDYRNLQPEEDPASAELVLIIAATWEQSRNPTRP